MNSSKFSFLQCCFVWACLLGMCLPACTTPAPHDDLTSPLDFQLPEGDELRLVSLELVEGRLKCTTEYSVKRLAPGPFPGTGEKVSRFELGATYKPVDDSPYFFQGFSYQRVDAAGEVTLGTMYAEINGRSIDELMVQDPPYIDLKAPLSLGSHWEFQSRRDVSRLKSEHVLFRFRKTVQAKELSVVVPAGRFERCLRIVTEGVSEQAFPIACGDSTRERHVLKHFIHYCCPGVGNVLEYHYERYGDSGRPDPACPVELTKDTLTAVVRAAAPVAPRRLD